MIIDQFWGIIDKAVAAHPTDLDARNDALKYHLHTLAPGEWRSFGKIYHEVDSAAYTWKLWGAAYEINGGCSDDGFDYFRGWLISQGRAVFEAALADPDTLVRLLDPEGAEHENEEILGLAWERIQEGDLEPFPADPAGEDWDFDDEAEMQRRYPRLCGVDSPEDPPPADDGPTVPKVTPPPLPARSTPPPLPPS